MSAGGISWCIQQSLRLDSDDDDDGLCLKWREMFLPICIYIHRSKLKLYKISKWLGNRIAYCR